MWGLVGARPAFPSLTDGGNDWVGREVSGIGVQVGV